MEHLGSCILMAFLAGVSAQNGPHVPDHGLVATAEGQLYAGQPAAAAEPLGAATGYAPRSGGYGGGGNGGYESTSYGGGGSGSGSYGGGGGYGGGGESGYVGNGGCYGRPAGVYGDASYDCKTFQVCQADGRLDTMYCPPYTRFNNYLGVCDWHFKVDAYCNPLYKEEYNNNYQSSYGGDNYEKGNSYGGSSPSYGGNNYQSGNSYEKPSSYGNNQGSYGGSGYGSASTSYGSGGAGSGGSGYSSGYRTPVYSLQSSYPAQQSSQAQKY